MEKPTTSNKSMNKILKFLPKAAQAAVSFQLNPPFSPGRDKHKAHTNKGFSGPIMSMIPAEARTKSRSFETAEPTSPKVSCMGQIKIKHKNKICKTKKHASLPRELNRVSSSRPEKVTKTKPELKKKPSASGLKKIFGSRRKSDALIIDHTAKPRLAERAPSLSQMRRFASSRDTFSNFDWTTAQIAPEEEDRDYYSDEDRGYSDGEDDVIIPFSAPILGAGDGAGAGYGGGLGLEPRKEINLWKRRTMAQPKPLQLNMGLSPPPRPNDGMEESDGDGPPPITVTPNQRKKKLKRHLVGAVSPTKMTENTNVEVPIHAHGTSDQTSSDFSAQSKNQADHPVPDAARENRWDPHHLKNTWRQTVSAPSYYTGEGEIDEFEQENVMEESHAAEGGEDSECNIPEGSLSEEEIRVMAAPYRRALVIKEKSTHHSNTEGTEADGGTRSSEVPTTHGPWNIVQPRNRRGPLRRENAKQLGKSKDSPVFYFGQGSNQAGKKDAPQAAAGNTTGTKVHEKEIADRGKKKMVNTERSDTGSRFDILNDVGEEELRGVEVNRDSGLRKNYQKETTPVAKRRIFKDKRKVQQTSVIHIKHVRPIERGNTYPIVNNSISSQVENEELLDKTSFTRPELDELYGIGDQQLGKNPSADRTYMGKQPRSHEPPGDGLIDSDEEASSEGVDFVDSVLDM
ncbi:hypothetical protein BUALT_Bualt08G0091500 [Buddleja alternifolia]|uniref:Uncharacterized protein n=1 Tax=Buddleja alternifolia TaxID=168488 RepID=A0AAV6XFW9_9LAMI|nr:hypothetical protein BUALT_Bualt08G0091500 [Buddleja alternifolia]